MVTEETEAALRHYEAQECQNAQMTTEREYDGERVLFPLEQDEFGWPPSSGEWLWCKRLSDDSYAVDNIPIYATGIAITDVIEANRVDNILQFVRIISASHHGTVRLMFSEGVSFQDSAVRDIWNALLQSGCAYEGLDSGPLCALDVPSAGSYDIIRDLLQRGEARGLWEYEEGKIPT